jgi:hypothetical protein
VYHAHPPASNGRASPFGQMLLPKYTWAMRTARQSPPARLLPALLWMAGMALLAGCSQPAPEVSVASPVATVTATPCLGTVTIETDPTGARIVLDGQPAGKSPVALTVAAGRHVIQVQAEGYASYRGTIDVVCGQRQLVEACSKILPRWLRSSHSSGRWDGGRTKRSCSSSDNRGVKELACM